MIAKLSALWARFKWVAWIVFAAVVAVLVLVLRRLFSSPSDKDRARYTMPAVPSAVQQRVEHAEEQAQVARVQASVHAEAKKEELQQIQQIPNGTERRRRLADMLRTLPP